MNRVALIDRNEIRQEEAQKQYEFVRYVLHEMEIPEEELSLCFPEEDDATLFTVDHKIKLRILLKRFEVLILEDGDGKIQIYVGKDLVAEWNKCKFVLREDPGEIDPKKRLYAEMHMNFWIFQQNVEE